MTAWMAVVDLISRLPASESYDDLLHSRPHWLFELTIELLSALVAFTAGWLWRNGLLRHLHRDLHALAHDEPRECVEPMPNPRGRRILHRPSPAHRQVPPETR